MDAKTKAFLDDLLSNFKIYKDVATTLIDEALLNGDEATVNTFNKSVKCRRNGMLEVLKSLERVGNITEKEMKEHAELFGVEI